MMISSWISFPMIIYTGIAAFLCLISTATVGFLIMKGKITVSLNWHMNLARLTILMVLIHVSLAMAYYLRL
jgi:heme/copper-type cytochrome/quinol oxidase subunit 2